MYYLMLKLIKIIRKNFKFHLINLNEDQTPRLIYGKAELVKIFGLIVVWLADKIK